MGRPFSHSRDAAQADHLCAVAAKSTRYSPTCWKPANSPYMVWIAWPPCAWAWSTGSTPALTIHEHHRPPRRI